MISRVGERPRESFPTLPIRSDQRIALLCSTHIEDIHAAQTDGNALINVMPHPTPLGQGVGEIEALVGLLIQRWSPRVRPNVYREKVVTEHAQTLSCLLMVKKWLMIL